MNIEKIFHVHNSYIFSELVYKQFFLTGGTVEVINQSPLNRFTRRTRVHKHVLQILGNLPTKPIFVNFKV